MTPPAAPHAGKPSDFGKTPGYRTIIGFGLPVLVAGMKRDWRGQEHLLHDRGFVVVANHITMLDPPALIHYLVAQHMRPHFMAKEVLFTTPIWGALMRSAEQIPVRRGTASAAESVQGAVEAVNQGKVVAIYPEGTTTKDPDLWPMAGKTGAARIALTTGCPVIPVAQWGTQKILPRGRVVPDFVHRHTVQVLAGPRVELDDLVGRQDDPAALREATERMMARITGLLEELRGPR